MRDFIEFIAPWGVISLVLTTTFLTFCGGSHSEYVADNAPDMLTQSGDFEVVVEEGYEWGFRVPFTNYGGAHQWYTLKRTDDNGLLYRARAYRWGDEIHIVGYRITEKHKIVVAGGDVTVSID